MSWKYYKNGKLEAESDDFPETIEDAVIELQENGHDVSDCVIEPESMTDLELYLSGTGSDDDIASCDDNWSPDYPPEEEEYEDTMMFKPLNDKELKALDKYFEILKGSTLKTSPDFIDKLNKRISKIAIKQSRFERFKAWCNKWTDKEVSYLIGWLFILYLMVGVVKYEPSILNVILWPFI